MGVGLYDFKKGTLGCYEIIYYITPEMWAVRIFRIGVMKLGFEPNSRTQTGFELDISDSHWVLIFLKAQTRNSHWVLKNPKQITKFGLPNKVQVLSIVMCAMRYWWYERNLNSLKVFKQRCWSTSTNWLKSTGTSVGDKKIKRLVSEEFVCAHIVLVIIDGCKCNMHVYWIFFSVNFLGCLFLSDFSFQECACVYCFQVV